jgi:prepilin-type N-terminal cleavage/methylation domain-containing protein
LRKAHSISTRHNHPSGAGPRGPASAFTLIEIVTVVVIMALLSAFAMPVYLDYRAEARRAAEQAVVASLRSAIHLTGCARR